MKWECPDEHMSRISTLWTLVHRAHGGEPQAVTAAQRAMLERYCGAVHRYLLGALRDPEAADELFQEFCVRFLRGYFRNARPERGRFRDLLKTAVFHLIVDRHRRRQKAPGPLLSGGACEPTFTSRSAAESDQEFLNSWRDELIARTWLALQGFEHASGQPHYTVLQFRTEHPDISSQQMAQELGERLGKTFGVHAIRQALHRAREKFSELFIQEIARTVEPPTRERIESELIDLGMISHCRPAFNRLYSESL